MTDFDLVSLSVAALFGVVVLALFALVTYILRVSGEREAELVRHKEKLVSLLECYGKQLTLLTERIEELAISQGKIEARLEKIDQRLWDAKQALRVVQTQNQIGERASVGQAAVGKDLQQGEE